MAAVPPPYTLRWDPDWLGMENSETAFLGEIDIGSIVKRTDGSGWSYSTRGLQTKWLTKGSGLVASREGARRAVNRVWRTWLLAAGLVS